MDAKVKTQEIQIGLELMLKFDQESWEAHYGTSYPLTPANALAHVMNMLEADRKGGAGVEVQHLETTGPDGDPIDENEGV